MRAPLSENTRAVEPVDPTTISAFPSPVTSATAGELNSDCPGLAVGSPPKLATIGEAATSVNVTAAALTRGPPELTAVTMNLARGQKDSGSEGGAETVHGSQESERRPLPRTYRRGRRVS